MKILLVNDYTASHGGAEIMLRQIRDGLRRQKHEVRVLASSAYEWADSDRPEYPCWGTTSGFRTLLQTANPSAFFRLRRALAEFRPDVVHVTMFLTQLSPLILPPLKRVPCIAHVVWYRPICPLGTKMLPDGSHCQSPAGAVCYRKGCLPMRDWAPLMVQMKLWRKWRSAFNLIVANSGAVKRRLVNEGIRPVEVVHNGVAEQKSRPPLRPPASVVFAGRLVREKGADTLIRAFRIVASKMPEARLTICGDGPERTRLEQLVRALELSSAVEISGRQPHEEMARILSEAWVVAVPSHWEEPFGLVAVEAMMVGTAVVASATGGLPEIVQDGHTGFLVPPANVEALAAALHRLLGNRELAETMGAAGRSIALAQFCETKMTERFLHLYQSLVANRNQHQ
jgi:glycosyltransferase involved in cell wall biosynthesis